MIPESQMPTYEDLLWPTLEALESIGGSASIQELSSRVATDTALPDEILDVLHKDGPQTEVDYRAAWARTHLRMIGAIDNTARGVWTITDRGRDVQSEEQARELVRNTRADRYKSKKARHAKAPEPETTAADEDQFATWENRLVVLHLRNGRRIYGWPKQWPGAEDARLFVIEDPKWLGDNGPVSAGEALAVQADDVEMVEFVSLLPDSPPKDAEDA